jgi:hypothetical protein
MSMITQENELTVGRKLWYVYGHLPHNAQKIEVLSEVLVSPRTNARYVRVMYDKDGKFPHRGDCHLADVGIGANYNMNRLFDTEAEALAFWHSPECANYRKHNGWIHTNMDYGYCEQSGSMM